MLDLYQHHTSRTNSELGNSTVYSATLEKNGKLEQKIWYELPSEHSEKVANSCDPFVLASLFWAMKSRVDLRVHGTVSPSLLRNLDAFQDIWSTWRPEKYSKIEITADCEEETLAKDNRSNTVMAFSGGLDACFTAFRHSTKQCGRQNQNLRAGVVVHGFDIPLDRPDLFKSACISNKMILDSQNLDLIPIKTNIGELKLGLDSFAALLASCLILLQKEYGIGLIGSSEPYDALMTPWGTHPLSDPLLSSDFFKVIHDGAAFTRTQKAGLLTQWPEALSNLRVCWHGPQFTPEHLGGNCGQCEKCIRTILNFRVLGHG